MHRIRFSKTVLAAVLLTAAPTLAAQEMATPEYERTITRTDQVTIGGQAVPYEVTAGFQPVLDEDGEAIAKLFYTYYRRTDVSDTDNRPLSVSFNGGPGSASLWMHLGYTSPKQLVIDDEGYPVQPYGVRDNPYSILDVTDIVFVNPVNTGFSRIIGDADRAQFFGVNEDVAYLAEWVNLFVTRQGRWASPKFLIGESYGTNRVSGLANRLQGAEWMFFNGVVLVSPTGLGVDRDGPVGDAIMLGHYAATAWHHGQLASMYQSMELEDYLPRVEQFIWDEYLPALARAGSLTEAQRNQIAERAADYAGVSAEWFLDYNLRPPVQAFRKELLREEGYTVGRLDARYIGVDRENAGESYDYDPALSAWNQAFSPAINVYLRDHLGWETDDQYWLFGPVGPWNRNGDNTGENLRSAMSENPFLHLLVQSGYYDGGTDYLGARYTMWNLDPAGRLQDRMRWEGYRSGHMMYLRMEDLATSNQHIRDFISWAVEALEGSARYER